MAGRDATARHAVTEVPLVGEPGSRRSGGIELEVRGDRARRGVHREACRRAGVGSNDDHGRCRP